MPGLGTEVLDYTSNNRLIYDIKSSKSFMLSLLSRKPVSCELYQKIVTLKL